MTPGVMTSGLPEVKRVQLGAISQSYLFWDSPGQDMLLLHATGFNPWLWLPVARLLWPRWRLFAPYIGEGRQGDPHSGGISWNLLAADLKEFAAFLGMKRPSIVGHSLGATLGAIAAGTHGLEVKALVLWEPVFYRREIYQMKLTVEDHPLARMAIKRTNFWPTRREAERYFRDKPLMRSWDEEVLQLYLRHGLVKTRGGWQLACLPQTEAALFMGGLLYDPWEDLAQVSSPVLTGEGERSTNRPYVDLPRAASLFPLGSYLNLAEAGHLLPQENPGLMADMVMGFLS